MSEHEIDLTQMNPLLYGALTEIVLNDLHDRPPRQEVYNMGFLLADVMRDAATRYRNPTIAAASLIPMFALDPKRVYALGRLRRGAMDAARRFRDNGAPTRVLDMMVLCARAFNRAEREFEKMLAHVSVEDQHMLRAAMVLAEVAPPYRFPQEVASAETFPLVVQHCAEALKTADDDDVVVLFL